MSGFSIELAADRIVDPRTRSYFLEVSRSFSNDCYRSSLVMLWTVVVCDLVYKLQTLRDLYGDTTAGAILVDVEKKRVANPNSPDWEVYLLDEIAKRTPMLESSEHMQLQHLQKLRHLSAHPVLTGADLLFRPTKEAARAQIRVALEAVLLKPALFTKRIIDTLVQDIAANKAVLISQETLKNYIEARYLPNMPLSVELELFRALWKFCFKLNNPDTQANRKINTATLAILYARNGGAIRTMIDSERTTFSNVGPDAEPLDALVEFLADHAELYGSIDQAAKILIDGRVKADVNNQVKASFLSVDMAAHLTALQTATGIAGISREVWTDLLANSETAGALEHALDLAVEIYGSSGSFDGADTRFSRFIEPALPKFTADRMAKLLQRVEGNSETWARRRARNDHSMIKDAADQLGVDTSPYPSFEANL